VKLGALVQGVTYRHPAIIANIVATHDQISHGRAICGIGAAWNQTEHKAYGIDLGTPGERSRRFAESAKIIRALLDGERVTFKGKYYQLKDAVLNTRPVQKRLPIMIGGGGEQKTLRLVAQYGDACNVGWGSPEALVHKLSVLRRHCEAIGRPYEDIERTTLTSVRVSKDGSSGRETPEQLIDRFGELGDAGAQHVLFSVRDAWQSDQLELLGSTVLAQLREA